MQQRIEGFAINLAASAAWTAVTTGAAGAIVGAIVAAIPGVPVWAVLFVGLVAAVLVLEGLNALRTHRKVSVENQALRSAARASTEVADVVLTEEVPPGAKALIAGRTYRGRTIRGPAVLLVQDDVSFVRCAFDGPPEVVLWETPSTKTQYVGVIGVTQTSFIECRFVNVGIAGRPELLAGFRADQERQADELRKQAGSLPSPIARIEFIQARREQFHSDASPSFHLTQLWFRNRGGTPTIAQRVTARVSVVEGSYLPVPPTFVAHWIDKNLPANMGPLDLENLTAEKDLPPNDIPAKLNLVLKWPGEEECYLFFREGLATYPDGRIRSHRLGLGHHELRVRLKGIGIGEGRTLAFDLHNTRDGVEIAPKQDAR